MRALKLALMLAGLLAIIQYIPAYYYASEFDSFVHNEVMRTRVKNQLKRDIMDRAKGNVDLENLTAEPGRPLYKEEKAKLKKLSEEEKLIRARYNERLDAIVTSLVIYSRPFHLIANQDKLLSVQFK